MNTYVAYRNTVTDDVFFNPLGFGTQKVGDEFYGAVVLMVGPLHLAQALVDAERAKLPPLSFDDLL